MDQPIVIAGLTRKRAELAGAIIAAEKHIADLRGSLEHLDATLKLFDPEARPTSIKPRQKRGPARFKAGELTRVILTVIREAGRALTIRDIMEKVAADHLIDISKPAEAKKLDYSIRSALARKRPGLACSVPEGEVMTWRVE